MNFLVDGMLGGLARWLRILGHDVRYESKATDNQLLQIAEKENMILLTKDAELAQRAKNRKLSSLLVVGKTEEGLAQIARTFGIGLDVTMTTTKCPECGSNLNEASKTEMAAKVPETSMMQHDKFWMCTGCGKVYWLGSHWTQIRQTLGNAKKIAGLST
jgi:uncharacterized protein